MNITEPIRRLIQSKRQSLKSLQSTQPDEPEPEVELYAAWLMLIEEQETHQKQVEKDTERLQNDLVKRVAEALGRTHEYRTSERQTATETTHTLTQTQTQTQIVVVPATPEPENIDLEEGCVSLGDDDEDELLGYPPRTGREEEPMDMGEQAPRESKNWCEISFV